MKGVVRRWEKDKNRIIDPASHRSFLSERACGRSQGAHGRRLTDALGETPSELRVASVDKGSGA